MAADRDDVIRCLFQTIATLASTPGVPETHVPKHHHNTSQIARTLAQLLHVDKDVIDGLRIAATLHDVGLVSVPADILMKPGPLSDFEYALIKGHPAIAKNMLKNIDFPWPVCDIILQHHERLDGSGYPRGLKGDEIMFEAQILAVADAMDSMISDRPWRKALSVEAALAELQKDRNIKFERQIVDVCEELYLRQKYRLDPEYYGRN